MKQHEAICGNGEFISLLWLFAAVLFTSGAAMAQGDGACAGDVERLCADAGADGRAIMRCLNRHTDELSLSCKDRLDTGRKKISDFFKACRNDALEHCQDVRPGGGRVLQCLSQHAEELSTECREKIGFEG